MAKKEQKKPSKKPQTKKAVKTKKAVSSDKKAAKVAAPSKNAASQAKKPAAPTIKAAAPKPAETKKFFSVAEFSDMTYLTEYGVMQWLKQGLLKGQQNEKGDWQIDASNLEVPNVMRLVR
jgi:outer membrane biosynthesis protein TonB